MDPTRTRSAGIGWRAEEPGLDSSEKSVESISGESERRSGWVSCQNKEIIKIWKKKKKSFAGIWKTRWILEIFARFYIFSLVSAFFLLKIAGIWLDLLELSLISPDLLKSKLDITGSPRI